MPSSPHPTHCSLHNPAPLTRRILNLVLLAVLCMQTSSAASGHAWMQRCLTCTLGGRRRACTSLSAPSSLEIDCVRLLDFAVLYKLVVADTTDYTEQSSAAMELAFIFLWMGALDHHPSCLVSSGLSSKRMVPDLWATCLSWTWYRHGASSC